jgi:SRSO17 transposase
MDLALAMISRALDARTPASWVTGDEVYGADPGLRASLEERGVCYVLAVAKATRGRFGRSGARGRALAQAAAAGLAAAVGRAGRHGPPLV